MVYDLKNEHPGVLARVKEDAIFICLYADTTTYSYGRWPARCTYEFGPDPVDRSLVDAVDESVLVVRR